MKKTYLMLLLALAGLGSSCTNEDGTEGPTPSGSAGEIQLVFSGSGESTEYTKAIASDSENKIANLQVYLFGAATAGAAETDCHYMETWTMTDATPGGGQFNLQPSGSSWTASIKPGEKKGLPYLTLVCVANQDDLFNANGDPFGALTAVVTNAATDEITTSGTTLDVFKAACTAKLKSTDILKTPLVMTGTGTTKISGSVSKVAITLKRIVARFDIDNTTATSQLTIQTVSMGQGRPNGSLFGAEPTADLITYADVDFVGENANQGTLESAIYVYPNLATDLSYLIIKGNYKSPSTGEQIPVTYNIPVVKTPENATAETPANYIAINANSRYKLRITDVTESNIYSTFEVEDWTSGGGVIIKPDNAKPEMSKMDGTNIPTLVEGMAPFYRTANAGTFNIVMTSTGPLECSSGLVTKADEEIDWLTIGTPASEQKDGLTVTTYPVIIADATGKHPVSLTFTNQAASYDPNLQTTLTFTGPAAAPIASEVVKGNSKGNTLSFTGSETLTTPKATMAKAVGSYVSLSLFCVDGLADVTPVTGYSVKAISTEGFTTTYRVTITDVSTAADGATIEFKSKENSETNKVTLTIEHKKASKPAIAKNDNDSYKNSTYNGKDLAGSDDAKTANMYLIDGSTIYVKATCLESAEAGAVTATSSDANLTVAEESDAPGIFKIEIPTATALTAESDVTVTFKNKADETATSTLTITPKSAVPTVELGVTDAVTNDGDGSYTIDPAKLSANTFTLTVTAPTGAGITSLETPFTDAGWLKLDGTNAGTTTITAGGNQVYTFTSGDTADEEGDVKLTFTNTVAGGGDLTVTLKKKSGTP